MSVEWCWAGARWWKFDFHTHTPESDDYGKGPDQETLKQHTPKEWLLDYMRAGVDCVAVTDHNTGAWIDELKDALEELKKEKHPDFRMLYLFPGVEISVNSGIHILAVLPLDKGTG
ncbi:MAG: ABC transporter, partial [Desulfobacterales bacterium]|nr:ABC transporter [Desulfobacterales bacterium]